MNCPICYEELNKDIINTQCNHSFHKGCLDKWNKNSCPMCRKGYKDNDNSVTTIGNLGDSDIYLVGNPMVFYMPPNGPIISDYIPKQIKPQRPKKRDTINKKYLKRRNKQLKNGIHKKLF